jgi:hypothetical protein
MSQRLGVATARSEVLRRGVATHAHAHAHAQGPDRGRFSFWENVSVWEALCIVDPSGRLRPLD